MTPIRQQAHGAWCILSLHNRYRYAVKKRYMLSSVLRSCVFIHEGFCVQNPIAVCDAHCSGVACQGTFHSSHTASTVVVYHLLLAELANPTEGRTVKCRHFMERQKEEMVDQVGAEGSAGQSNNHSSQCLPLVRISREGDTTVCSLSLIHI